MVRGKTTPNDVRPAANALRPDLFGKMKRRPASISDRDGLSALPVVKMAIKKRRGSEYADSQADIPAYLRDYSERNYAAEHFADAVCECSGRTFVLNIDETQGAGVRRCTACKREHPIGDSDEYLEDAHLEECGCPCGAEGLELTIGVALYRDSEDVRWLYIGARCIHCGMVGCYADWKNEFIGYQDLLARV